MTVSKRIIVSTEAGRGLTTTKVSPKFTRLRLPGAIGQEQEIFFWEGKPFASFDGSYVYTYDNRSAAQLRAIASWTARNPLQILAINTFEYYIGQALSKAGLILVRRLDA